jgi:predicted DNA-binding transcriptional regulator YafY
MSKHGIIRRYTLEIEKISGGFYPSFEEIKEYLFGYAFKISNRTLERDIEQIRFEFGLSIQYDRSKNGYYIDAENSLNIDSFFRFLEIVNTAELLTESLQESKNVLSHISFDMGGGLTGIEHIKTCLRAIKDRNKISFTHHNFHTNKSRKYTIKPYLLKEYQNRWYVVGLVGGINEFRTFGIDRIENLNLLAETYVVDEKLDPAEMFTKIVGLVYSLDKQQEVVLSFTAQQGKYVKTLPIHFTQKVLIDNEEEFRISLFIIPNYEFTQLILKHGDTVKVIEPASLVNEIKENLRRALGRYS